MICNASHCDGHKLDDASPSFSTPALSPGREHDEYIWAWQSDIYVCVYIYDVISSFVLKFYILSFISIPLISINIKNVFRHIFSTLTWSLPDFGPLRMTNFLLAFKLIILHSYVSFELWNTNKWNIWVKSFCTVIIFFHYCNT